MKEFRKDFLLFIRDIRDWIRCTEVVMIFYYLRAVLITLLFFLAHIQMVSRSEQRESAVRILNEVHKNPQRLYAGRFQVINWSRRFEDDDIVRSLWRHRVNTTLINK